MKIEKGVLLKKYTTFKIGGPAEYFADVKNVADLQEVLKWAKENKQPIKILGGGSNMLISDNGLKGLVIKLSLDKLEFDDTKVTVGPGVMLAYLLNMAIKNGLTGLEFAAGIPGTVGGATRGNAGTYGIAMDSVVKSIKYLDEDLNSKEMPASEAQFAYRHSIFKEKAWIILELNIELEKGDVKAAQALIKERLEYRQNTQPNLPSAGCIFKNVQFKNVNLKELKAKNIEIEKFDKFKKIPAAYIIERAGLKGHKIGDAQVSELHANYIVNNGQATAEQVIMLISFIKQQVRDKYGVQLQEEVQLLV